MDPAAQPLAATLATMRLLTSPKSLQNLPDDANFVANRNAMIAQATALSGPVATHYDSFNDPVGLFDG